MKPTLQIEGRSGCKLELIEYDQKIIVRKFSASLAYNNRLLAQQTKQTLFTQHIPESLNFNTPKIFADGITHKGLCYFDMEYISGDKYSTYFYKIDATQIKRITSQLIQYFAHSFTNAKLEWGHEKIFTQKQQQVIESLSKNKGLTAAFINRLSTYLTAIPYSPILIGPCHGDFTFSNMLFTPSNKIYTFDMLDSFIESPLIDWVKLKQDTLYFWSLFIENEKTIHTTKIKQVMQYMNRVLDSYFGDKPEIYIWEKYLTVFNFARILPYAKDERDLNYLIHHLQNLILV